MCAVYQQARSVIVDRHCMLVKCKIFKVNTEGSSVAKLQLALAIPSTISK